MSSATAMGCHISLTLVWELPRGRDGNEAERPGVDLVTFVARPHRHEECGDVPPTGEEVVAPALPERRSS